MKLFKYIDFEKDYSGQPLAEGSLYFSSIEQLRGVNDHEEFDHRWDSDSPFFQNYAQPLRASYERLFGNSRVLCLGKNFNATCWQTFCPSGSGVCYEFDFNAGLCGDVTHGHIVYANNRQFNVPSYVFSEIENEYWRETLRSSESLLEINRVIREMNRNRYFNGLLEEHILRELTLKKRTDFRKEREYRFIHLVEPTGPVFPQVKMNQFKINFADLGLRLTSIYSSHPDRVGTASVRVLKPSFLR